MTRDDAQALVDQIYDEIEQKNASPVRQTVCIGKDDLVRRLQLIELLIGDWLRQRLTDEIAPLANQPDNTEIEHRRGLMLLGRIMLDLQPIVPTKLGDIVAGDTTRMLNGQQGLLLRPVSRGRGVIPYDDEELTLIRRYVLRVRVECARQKEQQERFLNKQPRGPSMDQFRSWSEKHAPRRARKLADAIGKAFHAKQALTPDQTALWLEIKDHDLLEIWNFIRERGLRAGK
jgi:hypothetical protein